MADESTTGAPDTGGGSGGSVSGGTGSAAPADTPITLTETSRFIPPGGKDPVSWKDYNSGVVPKDELTRMRQRDAAERQAWQQTERTRIQQEWQQQQQQHAQSTQAATQTSQFIDQLEKAPYVDGRTMAQFVRAVGQQLSQSQQAVQLLHQQNQQLRQSVGSMSGRSAQQELSSLFASTKSSLGLPDDPNIDEIMQDVYYSHTGWETDPQAFPQMVGQRWAALQNLLRAADKKRAEEARQQARPFGGQAAGGQGRPMKPLLKGNESAEDLANRLWSGMRGTDT